MAKNRTREKRQYDARAANAWGIINGLDENSILLVLDVKDAELICEVAEWATKDPEYEECFTGEERLKVSKLVRRTLRKVQDKTNGAGKH